MCCSRQITALLQPNLWDQMCLCTKSIGRYFGLLDFSCSQIQANICISLKNISMWYNPTNKLAQISWTSMAEVRTQTRVRKIIIRVWKQLKTNVCFIFHTFLPSLLFFIIVKSNQINSVQFYIFSALTIAQIKQFMDYDILDTTSLQINRIL